MDLSCDYLIDITGLTDVPKEVYSCARQDGACENKNCPAAKNFEKKSSDYETTIDYDSATIKRLCRRLSGGETTMAEDFEGKRLCPLMDLARVVAVGASKGRISATLEAIQCKGGSCAWWDADKERCAVLSLARNK